MSLDTRGVQIANGSKNPDDEQGFVDRIQNHVATGSRASAVAAVYNKAQKLPERAAALDAWARMVTQDRSNVVTLRQA